MPTMANITVKLADNVTDFVFVALQPAGPDGSPAFWRREDTSKPVEQRITAAVSTRWNDKRNARVASSLIRYPVLEATGVAGVNKLLGWAECRDGRFVVPTSMSQAAMDDFSAVSTNFMASPLIKSVISSGFAPG